MRKYNNVSFSRTFHFVIYKLPPPPHPKMTVIHTLRFLSVPYEYKWNPKGSFTVDTFEKFVWGVQILSFSWKKKLGSPYMKTCHSWGEGVRIKNRTSHCLISSKGTLIFTFDHRVFLHSAKLCPTPPAASPHNFSAMLRLHKSNLMISPAKNKGR